MTQRTAPAGPPAGPTGGLPPDPAPLFELAVAYWRSAALFAALDLAVFEAVDDTPRSPAELATALKLPPRPLSVLLEALAALGLLERTSDDHYRATPLTRAYLRRGGPAWLGDAIAFNARSYPAWGKLAAAVRADTPAQPPAQILGADPGMLVPDPRPPSGAPRPRDCHLDCSDLERLDIGQRTPFVAAITRLLGDCRT